MNQPLMNPVVYLAGAFAISLVLVACGPDAEVAVSEAAGAAEGAEPGASQPPAPAPVVELADRIEVIAQSCAACHGTQGRLETDVPAIAGRPEPVLSAQLLAFKRDEMPEATVMPRLAKGFTDEELEALAAYFAALEDE